MGRPTVHDIARTAEVSLATVDRVINERPGVRPATVARVQAAIADLGYVRDLGAANLARGRLYRFRFLLPAVQSQFLAGLSAAIEEAGQQLRAERCELSVLRVDLDNPITASREMAALLDAPVDGVAIMANETPMVRDLIGRLDAAGTAVVSLVTDQTDAPRAHFVGIDNIAAGRTAATLMGRFLPNTPARIAVVVNTMLARDMVERRLGFDAVLAHDFPHLSALPSVEGHDDHAQTAQVTATCLAANPDVTGLYCAGAGTRGVTQALSDLGLTDRLTVIGHELTAHTRTALLDGTIDAVITQNVGHLARSAVRVLRARCDGREIIESQEQIRIDIVLKENLPAH
ncbi:MAG: LacI family DNA-binding transcriptional regulator [Pseudomonadota bacterium]